MSYLLLVWIYIQPTLQVDFTIAKDAHAGIPKQFETLTIPFSPEIGVSYWIKANISGGSGHYILTGGNPYMKAMSFYTKRGELVSSGNNISLSLQPDSVSTYLIYYPFADEKNHSGFKIELIPERQFIKNEHSREVLQAIFQSILIFLFLVSMFFAFMSGDQVYLYYGLYALSTSCFFGYQSGLMGDLLPAVNSIPPMWFWLFAFLLTLFYALFTIFFLDMKKQDLLAYRLMKVGIWYMLGLFLLSTVLYLFRVDVQQSMYYKIPTITIELILILSVLIRIIRFKGLIKRFYLAGVSILLVISIGGQLLSTLGLMSNFQVIIQAGLLMEVFVLALGMAARVNLIQKTRNQTQKALIEQLKRNEQLEKQHSMELERKVLERAATIVQRNKENELLLREVHHRVKNNLQMITSLLNIQQRRVSSESTLNIIEATKNKIKSIALIHEHLYSTENFSHIQLHSYIERLLKMLTDSRDTKRNIELSSKVEALKADIDTAIPIGLILNELVTNAFKYAFGESNNSPKLLVEIFEEDDKLKIFVIDNGPGFIRENSQTGLGLTIIHAILESHVGNIDFLYSSRGFVVKVELTEYTLISEM